ncbi:MAG: N-formylglutamate amidohydrolase [Candidatus Marinimicrobia bacterium]|nr:N-formylglutamate amidohydrolase [Candidatus Neomarinimicrobiota bacterium]
MTLKMIISCEHGGHQIPEPYQSLFENHQEVLQSHRGWDAGALDLAQHLQQEFSAVFHFTETSRLLVDCNRSMGDTALFSEITRDIPEIQQQEILRTCYFAHRNPIEQQVQEWIRAGNLVFHVAVHSFTQVLNGRTRSSDIGLLFDPRRPLEKQFADIWRRQLSRGFSGWKIHHNLPYRGVSDGLPTFLRSQFDAAHYVGFEFELNQKHVGASVHEWNQIKQSILMSVSQSLEHNSGLSY